MNLSKLYVQNDTDLAWRLFLLFSIIGVILLSSDVVLAADPTDTDPISEALCRVVAVLEGGVAKGIATMAIVAVGIGLFLGKVSWSIAAATAAGVGIIFGASKLVGLLAGDDTLKVCVATP